MAGSKKRDAGSGFIGGDGALSPSAAEKPSSSRRKKTNRTEGPGSFFIESLSGSPLFPDKGFIETVTRRWGGYDRSTKKVWVQYDRDDQAAKSKVDFENGVIIIETVVEAESPQEARQLSREAVARRMKRLYEEDRKSPIPVIENYVVDSKGAPLAEREIVGFIGDPGFVIEVTEKPPAKERKKKPGEGRPDKKRYEARSEVKMAPDHLHQRARKVFPIVQKQCKEYQLEESLVLSVIHVESYFNPRAVSPVGAVGLMQLMPNHGGREAYQWLHGENWSPDRYYLIDPTNNIQLGCTYLHLLRTDHFQDVKDDFKNRYASVAGYNWGPANVRKKVLEAGNISRMGSEEFFKFLYQRAPEETKNYIVRVREHAGNYKETLTKSGGGA